jgi:hypothetical protein
MTDTALGLSPAHWSAIGAFIAIVSLIYLIWLNHNKDKNQKEKTGSKKRDGKHKTRLSDKKDKLEKERMKVIKQEIKQLRSGRLRVVEEESKITKKKPYLQFLGELTGGSRLEGTCKGTMGGKFTYYILDEVNKDLYKKNGELKSPIRSGMDKNKFTFKVTIPRDNQYYILFTTRATKNPRNVHYKIKIIND